MENPTAFDLNESIQLWRQKLAASPGLRAGDLEELEAHLRDSIRALKAAGLSADEAFLVATRRAGHPETLGAEFAKLNPETVWVNRALWMVAGFLTIRLISGLSEELARTAGVGLNMLKVSSQTLGALEVAVNAALFTGLLRWLWLSATRPAGLLRRAANWFKGRPVTLGLCVFGLLTGMQVLGFAVSFFEARNLTHEYRITFAYSSFGAAIFSLLVWPLALGWLMKRNHAPAKK